MNNKLSLLGFVCCCIFIFISCSKNTTPTKSFDWNATKFEQNGYALIWQNNDAGFNMDLKKQLIETFFTLYPKIAKEYNSNATKTVLFSIDTAYKGVAAASGTTIIFNPRWFDKQPKDIDVVTHEVMHIVQSYPNYNPWWLVEGIADYVRYKYGVANAEGGWSLPTVSPSHKYDNGYRVTARFLAWCENKKPGSVKAFDYALRTATYNTHLWITLFGKSVSDLWDEYKSNNSIR